jgi:hypothetical protein
MYDIVRDQRAEAVRYFAFLGGILLLFAAVFGGLSLYERTVLGEYRLGIGSAPYYTPYYLGRLLVAFLLSLVFVAGVYRLSEPEAPLHVARLPAGKRTAAWVMLAVATVCLLLFGVSPQFFYEIAVEDRPLEWASALLPLASSLAFAYAFYRILVTDQRDTRRSVSLVLAALFAITLFVIGMEEISWMQRLFNIETPAAFAGNQQQEMNRHNMHSILFGNAHKLAMIFGLIVLPFLVDTAPKNALFDSIRDFLPGRFVLIVSAPFMAFNYNGWNMFLTPLTVALAVLILLYYARAAHDRGDRAERRLFRALAAFVVIAQTLFLAAGHTFVRTWDTSEYGELFMAIGLALFTWQSTSRLIARYGATQAPPLNAVPAGP